MLIGRHIFGLFLRPELQSALSSRREEIGELKDNNLKWANEVKILEMMNLSQVRLHWKPDSKLV